MIFFSYQKYIWHTKINDESEEVREEKSRQLDKSVVKDWNYQVGFNQRRRMEEKLQNEAEAVHEKQVK